MSTSDQPPSADRTTGPVRARAGGATQTADRPCVDCLDPSVAVAKPARRLSRPAAFWLIAYAFAVTMLGTTLPTPLYVIFQGQWHFSTSLITLIFASYAVAVLTALLLAGRSSDQVRPASGAGGGDLPEHRQRGDVHPRAERRLAVCRAGAVRPVGRADDRHRHRRADRDGAARRRAPCVAGLVGRQPGRTRSRTAAGRAASPVRARSDGASLRGPARAGGRRPGSACWSCPRR